jgi:peptidoglycan hydrolase CwlO-like protein
MKYRILLLFSVLTFGLFFPKANNSALAQSNEDFTTTLYKTRKEVSDITQGIEYLLSNRKKLLFEINTLTNDIDKVLLKFKKKRLEDLMNINKRINTLRDKVLDSESKIDDFKKRTAVIDCQLDENPRLKNLVYDVNFLYKTIDKWKVFTKEFDARFDIFLDKVAEFKSKVKTLPYIREIQKVLDNDITRGWQALLSDEKKLLSEIDLLINDIDKIIGKIDKNEITNYNNEIKNINDRIGNLDNKNDDIIDRQNELYSKADSVSKTPEVGNLVIWTDYNKVVDEWHALMSEQDNPKWDIYNKKLDALKSKVENFSPVRKLQNEIADITNGRKTLLSDEKNLLSEMDLLMKDMDRVIGKIDRREITNYNNEIKNINDRIGNLDNKDDDINSRYDNLKSRTDAVSKTPGVGYLIVWTDYNKVINEWSALIDEEDSPKWKIYNEKLDALKSKVKDFTDIRKLQDKVPDITNEWKTLISDDKKLLTEMDYLMKDIDRVIGKIDRREITNYNNEIKDVNNRISSINDKSDDIDHRFDELRSRADSVSKTPGVGYMVDWTDKNKVVDEWNTLMDEEDNPKWDIYNKKVETYNSITANLSNHP